jgi:hypothetical protein
MKLITAPEPLEWSREETRSIFLAGTIDMGNSPDWQREVIDYLSDRNVVILNPRRDFYNANLEEQVNWELDGLMRVDMIGMYFAPGSKSPVTMLEFGLFAAKHKLIVCCPEGFWRKSNIDIVCGRYDIPQCDNLEHFKEKLKSCLVD